MVWTCIESVMSRKAGGAAMRGELLRRHVIQTAAGTFVIVFVAPGDAASPAIQASAARGLSGWAGAGTDFRSA